MSHAVRLAACTVTCALSMVTSGARAVDGAPLRMAVGEIGGAEQGELRSALTDALRADPDLRLTPRASAELVVSGSVLRSEERRTEGRLRVDCAVSVIVSDARSGAILAMLEGRAGAIGGEPHALHRNALRAAVRGALRPLPSQGRALARR
ncbi:MAG: hypothetical protein AB7S26_10390 [Sandaracinaceae bacterium]